MKITPIRKAIPPLEKVVLELKPEEVITLANVLSEGIMNSQHWYRFYDHGMSAPVQFAGELIKALRAAPTQVGESEWTVVTT